MKTKTNRIFIKTRVGLVPVLISDIMYCEAFMGGFKVYKLNGEVVQSDFPLKELWKILKSYTFLKCGKSYLTNIDYIISIEPVSRYVTMPNKIIKHAKSCKAALAKFIDINSDDNLLLTN